MKTVVKIIAIVLLIAGFAYLFVGGGPLFADAATTVQNTQWSQFPAQDGYTRSLLPAEQQVIYDAFMQGINEGAESTTIKNRDYTGEDVSAAVRAVMFDRPELFWVDFENLGYGIDSEGLKLTFAYKYEGEEKTTMQTQLDTKVDEIMGLMGGQQLVTAYEKATYLHDYIIKHCSYDQTQTRANTHNLYGALVEGSAVCDGYARAFQYLLTKAGIENYLVEGQASQTDIATGAIKTEGHAWNKANLDGVITNIDVTWDDPDYELDNTAIDANIVSHTYFGLSDAEISRSHTADTAFPAPAGEASWWLSSRGLVGETPSDIAEEAAGVLVRNASATSSYVEIVLTDAEAYDAFWRSYDAGVDQILERANELQAANGKPEFASARFVRVSADLGTVIVIGSFEEGAENTPEQPETPDDNADADEAA